MSREDLFAPRSLSFAWHSLFFEPSEGERKRRELPFERREEPFVSHSPAFEPLERLFAAHSPAFEPSEELFAPYSPELEWLEERGTRHYKLFARRSSVIA